MNGRPSQNFFNHPLFYFISLFAIIGVLGFVGSKYIAAPVPVISHRDFPTESEVNSAVHTGQTEDDVVSQFGEPSNQGEIDGGLAVMDYVAPQSSASAGDSSAYSGFAVYLKDGKVVDVTILRGSDLHN